MNLDEWCIRHDLEIERAYCPTCQEALKTTIPIEYPESKAVGLKCPPCHACGEEGTPEFSICHCDEMNALLSKAFIEEEEKVS